MAASPECLIFAMSLPLDMTNLGSYPGVFNQSFPIIKAYCLQSKGLQYVHIEVFNRDGTLGSVSESHL
jgi:hypothetical protein